MLAKRNDQVKIEIERLLAVDITVRSALTAHGSTCPDAGHTDGAVLLRARLDKERKYHEHLDAER